MKREGLCLALSIALHAALWQIPRPEAPQALVSVTTVAPLGEPIPVVTLPPPPALPETMPLPTAGLVVAALPSQPLREIELNPQGLPPPLTFELPEVEFPKKVSPPPIPPPPAETIMPAQPPACRR
ncbi:MAG: hypothetical protein ACUVSQ_13135, partial [Pseudanabaenaceae cyanobacterium]